MTATFHPAGAPGLLYWHALTPAHWLIFPGLARAIASRAEGAAGNGALVEALARIAHECGREVATPAEARARLGLQDAPTAA